MSGACSSIGRFAARVPAAAVAALLLMLVGCPTAEDDDDSAIEDPTPDDDDSAPAGTWPVVVEVLLDGSPTAGVSVAQGGFPERQITDAEGLATVDFDFDFDAELWVLASHPEARQTGSPVEGPPAAEDAPIRIELTRFDPSDNEDFLFRDPGSPTNMASTDQCAHCHRTINEDWFSSPHSTSASNPAVQDLYAGVRSDVADAVTCEDLGGAWRTGLLPGSAEAAERCYVGAGALPALNEDCGDDVTCDEVASVFGACADCHAPGIDGPLGGRDLLEAIGYAYDDGVHCDVCHHVESVDLEAPPGVAGRLHLVRPSEPGGFGQPWLPLLFGPYDDVPNGVMGAVQRDHFGESRFCAGCHEQLQSVLLPGAAADPGRWPDGLLPIHTTFSEWEDGPLNPNLPCRSCHMPPDPDVTNAADLQLFDLTPGFVPGWVRPEGSVRQHSWVGPRNAESGLLQLAASLTISKEVTDDELVAQVTTRNVGAGHSIPTGEPMRSLVLQVEARCDDDLLQPAGGDVIPDFGGALARRPSGEDWSSWPGAEAGHVIRVVEVTEAWHDYTGYGPFGDGTFDAAGKGMPVETWVGEAVVESVDGDVVTLSTPLPEGDVAYLVEAGGLPSDGDPAIARAGSPGFGFARVLAGDDGARMVPHFAAVDVVSDNRILPQEEWTSTHRFEATCADPTVRAVLVHRAYPLPLARERGWDLVESVMAEIEE